MNVIALLLSPRYKKFRHKLRTPGREKLRILLPIILIMGLWALIYIAFVKALYYFTAEEMFGTIAAVKLLSMLLVTFSFVALISNIIAIFSTFYLSEDLELIIPSPTPAWAVYSARFIETMFDSSWMVLVFGFPVFLAYGKVFSAPLSFYLLSFLGFFLLLSMLTSLAVLLVETLVRVFPVRRLRDLFVFIGLLIFIGLYLLFRMIRPEEFLNPEGFASVMDYLSIMSESSSPLLPTTWLMQIIRPYVTGYGYDNIPLNFGLLFFGAATLFRLAGHNHEVIHFFGFSKAVESRGARLSKSRFISALGKGLGRYFDASTSQLILKETLLMARDWGRLSQLLLLLALILVYLYNFSVLPSLDSPEATFFLKNTIAFLNIGLAGFVLSSLGVRFLFPAVSSEGRAFWILKGAPVGLRRILWVKFGFYLIPMLMLGLFLAMATNKLLGLGPAMFIISTTTIAILTVGITSLSLGMGVLHADLKESDPNKVFSGIGGLLTMIYSALAVAAIIMLEAVPVYRIVTAEYYGHGFLIKDYLIIASGFFGAIAVALFLIIKPLKSGLDKITELQI